MRIALIVVGDAVGAANETGLIAGRSLARHQLDFALALGCEKIVLLGHGAGEEAIALRHAAEASGAQVQIVRVVRDLPAAVRGDDNLLVLAHGLLPESQVAFGLLAESPGLLILPAEAGWSAGFERLDLTAAWGGAMVVPGRLAAGLDQLPDDAEPVAGLLRIARQAGVPERPLPERELAEGRWQIVRTAEAARAVEPAWLQRRLPATSAFRPTGWLAQWLIRRFGVRWVGDRRAGAASVAAALVSLLSAFAAGWFGLPVLGFALLIPAALAIEGGDALRLLGKSIFKDRTARSRISLSLHLMWDVALVVLGVLAIDGSRVHRLFAPLVAGGLLNVPPLWTSRWRALAGDRGLLAVLLAVAAGPGLAEGGFMLIALVQIALRLALPAGERG